MKRGIIIFYINFFPDLNQDIDTVLNHVKEHNKEIIHKLKESEYEAMFIPTTKEASRVEKVDFDQPFPRFLNKQYKEKDDE